VESQSVRAAQRLLQHARTFRLSITFRLQHDSRRCDTGRHTVGRNTTPQLPPEPLIKLDRLPLRRFPLSLLQGLKLTLLIKQQPRISAGDRLPTKIVNHNLDIAASMEGTPPANRLRQIQGEHGQRNRVSRNIDKRRRRRNFNRV
jgi:hypothetical protein